MDACPDCAGRIDDYEKIRTRTIRTLSERVDMLDDALHALRAGRYHVVEEFLDRSIAALRTDVAALRDD